MTKWCQTRCPAIGWRHSVLSKPFKNSKTYFCAHQFKRHATYCINIAIYCHLYWKSSCRWFDSAPGHHFQKQYQRLNFWVLMLCVWDSKTHQTHTFCGVWVSWFLGSTLCLQPSETTQSFVKILRIKTYTVRYVCVVNLGFIRDGSYKSLFAIC